MIISPFPHSAMFSTSTQRQHWMFSGEEAVSLERERAHESFVQKHSTGDKQQEKQFLTLEEAGLLRSYYERKLMEFCARFSPPMPKGVQGTAVQYYKRFYIRNSVMDYHPKEIL